MGKNLMKAIDGIGRARIESLLKDKFSYQKIISYECRIIGEDGNLHNENFDRLIRLMRLNGCEISAGFSSGIFLPGHSDVPLQEIPVNGIWFCRIKYPYLKGQFVSAGVENHRYVYSGLNRYETFETNIPVINLREKTDFLGTFDFLVPSLEEIPVLENILQFSKNERDLSWDRINGNYDWYSAHMHCSFP